MRRLSFIKDCLLDVRLICLFFLLQFPSLRAFYKYLPGHLHKFVPLFLLLIYLASALFLKAAASLKWFRIFLSRKIVFIGLIFIVIVINAFVYPIADSLKYWGRGSDQDDALIVTALNLISGRNPYEARTYFHINPISPGPGWIILNIPFTLTGLYFLLVPTYLFTLLFFIKKISKGYYLPNIFLVLCISSLAFWETTVVGSDMFAIGVLLTLAFASFFYGINKGWHLLLFGSLMLGFVASSRIVFAYAILILGIFVYKRSGLKKITYLLLAAGITLIFHLSFYLWSPSFYSPVHIFFKAGKFMNEWLKIITIVLSLAAFVLACLKSRYSLTSWLFFLFLSLGIPLLFISAGDLSNFCSFKFSQWEGANYFMIVLPIYLSYFVLKV